MNRSGIRRRPRRRTRAAVAAVLTPLAVLATLAGSAGCAAQAGASNPIQLGAAYVPVPRTPGTTVAYVVIRNNGPADKLVAARISAGGRVFFQAASASDSTTAPALRSVAVPGQSTLSLAPDSVHMVITGAGPLRGGHVITLTLVFARAGPVSVEAEITNPATGGSSYFEN